MGKAKKATSPRKGTDGPCLSDEVIAAAQRILSNGNRVELVPVKGNNIRIFELRQREAVKRVDSGGGTVL